MTRLLNNSQMQNDIMAVGLENVLQCLLRVTMHNGALTVLVVGDEPGQLRRVQEETYANTTPENRRLIDTEDEAINMILNGIGESINKQDVKTKLFWEFGKFTSRDGKSVESYYSRFYKTMNEMVRNKLKVDTMQENVQFLQQLQLEWSRFITIVKQQQDLDTVSYHTLFDILKQHQNEVNEIRAEKIARNAKPLALALFGKSKYRTVTMTMSTETKEIRRIKRLHCRIWDLTNDTEPLAKYSNVTPDSSDMCDNEGTADQNAEEPEDERVLLASLIANFKLDIDENKKSQKQLKKANTSLTQELEKSKQDLEKSKQDLSYCKSELEKYKIFQTNHKDKEKAELECAKAY
ncbi:hypothetical protein Tco_1149407 [Tanacetum coccineum]